MHLFAPGMTLLHRAGLGGLACTLRYIEQAQRKRQLSEARVPGAPWQGGQAPWEISEQEVTLRFGAPEKAGEFLERLFRLAFQTVDGLIYLPGQYSTEPNQAVRADLQAGLTLTFLQHGKVRKLSKEPTTASHDPEGEGVPGVVVQFRACESFKHQNGWENLVDNKGCLVAAPQRIDGPICPGAVVRHVAFTAGTAAEDPPERLLPLLFAIVGCLALPVNRGVAALIVPEVESLTAFTALRPLMTPTSAKECQITSAADGALQAQVRLRGKQAVRDYGLPGCYSMTFMPTAWASQQKSRVSTIHIPPGEEKRLDRFEEALAELPPKIVKRVIVESTSRGRKKVTTERTEAFRVDSIVRPLVAENLALGRPWYAGFVRLMTGLDPGGNPLRNKLPFERRGLNAMTSSDVFWDHAGEAAVVRAVHEALRNRYGKIADENKGKPGTMKNRFASEYDRWRLAFAGAKTSDQFRKALCDLFSRAGNNSVLRGAWTDVLPFLAPGRWQLTRDLALLALASYVGKGVPASGEAPETTSKSEQP
jgi:CRISPR-associated protein Cas8a1/Csx13